MSAARLALIGAAMGAVVGGTAAFLAALLRPRRFATYGRTAAAPDQRRT